MRKTRAFTLIELLIVVAIIAILAAIAVPNFLEAQTRSKVSRVKADLRTIATGIESYSVDNNTRYPFDLDSRGWPWYLTDVITTPVAYLTNGSLMSDPFRVTQPNTSARRYRYLYYEANRTPGWGTSPYPGPFISSTRPSWAGAFSDSVANSGINLFGQYKMSSAGPDQTANTSFALGELIYDPSNGTVSAGDIIRSQKGQKE